jgi:hypothetical protein
MSICGDTRTSTRSVCCCVKAGFNLVMVLVLSVEKEDTYKKKCKFNQTQTSPPDYGYFHSWVPSSSWAWPYASVHASLGQPNPFCLLSSGVTQTTDSLASLTNTTMDHNTPFGFGSLTPVRALLHPLPAGSS